MKEIKSIDVADIKLTLTGYLESRKDVPLEILRMIVKEVYDDLAGKAHMEMLAQAQEREATKNEQSIQ